MEDIQVFDFNAKKKPTKKKTTKDAQDPKAESQQAEEAKGQEVAQAKETEHSAVYRDAFNYEMLLTRIYNILKANNPALSEKTKLVIKPPQIVKATGKRTFWVNFVEICNQMKRTPEHVLAFVTAELGAEGSINEEKMLLKDKFNTKQIESLLKKYINEYVICSLCKTSNTVLIKDSNTRLYILKCESCQSTRTVTSIRTGYHAVTKADRKK